MWYNGCFVWLNCCYVERCYILVVWVCFFDFYDRNSDFILFVVENEYWYMVILGIDGNIF